TAYVYDLNGNLQEKTEHGDDGSQLVTRYERDHAGRLVRKTLPDADCVKTQPAKVKNKCPDLSGHLFF
ncbi:RHS repeat domain-containing protein, partial [Pseudomonas marginalis]|uniref:RHS repeat domain-containing protein n=1 Tax=Pseudomonas marginalis TaxID=298 RepID=UPI002B1CDB17